MFDVISSTRFQLLDFNKPILNYTLTTGKYLISILINWSLHSGVISVLSLPDS